MELSLRLAPFEGTPSHDRWHDPAFRDTTGGFSGAAAQAFMRLWLDTFGSYHSGAMTAYLLRAFGLPNINQDGWDPAKHPMTWGLDTGEGILVVVEPKPLELSADWVSQNMDQAYQQMVANRVFSFKPLRAAPRYLNGAFLRELIEEFRRPVAVHDVLMDPLGVESSRHRGVPLHGRERAFARDVRRATVMNTVPAIARA